MSRPDLDALSNWQSSHVVPGCQRQIDSVQLKLEQRTTFQSTVQVIVCMTCELAVDVLIPWNWQTQVRCASVNHSSACAIIAHVKLDTTNAHSHDANLPVTNVNVHNIVPLHFL